MHCVVLKTRIIPFERLNTRFACEKQDIPKESQRTKTVNMAIIQCESDENIANKKVHDGFNNALKGTWRNRLEKGKAMRSPNGRGTCQAIPA